MLIYQITFLYPPKEPKRKLEEKQTNIDHWQEDDLTETDR